MTDKQVSLLREECCGRGKSKCKGTKVRAWFVWFGKNKEIPIFGAWYGRGSLVEEQVRKLVWVMWGLES